MNACCSYGRRTIPGLFPDEVLGGWLLVLFAFLINFFFFEGLVGLDTDAELFGSSIYSCLNLVW